MPEDGGADRPRDEADGIDGEGLERADPWVGVREEQLGEDEAGDGAVEEEVVPFDRGPDGGGDDGAAKLNLMLGWGEGSGLDIEGCHELVLRNSPRRELGQEPAFFGETRLAAEGSSDRWQVAARL